jgi:hypothetical protein
VQSDGKVIGKEELLKSSRKGQRKWEIAESDPYEIRLLENVGLLIGQWSGKGINQGKELDYTARFLAVYQLEAGPWKLVSDLSIPIVG